MCLSISATVALGCLFAPKVYIVLFQPHKNVRHNVAAALNPQGQRGAGRPFLSRRSNNSGLMGAMNGNFTSPSKCISNMIFHVKFTLNGTCLHHNIFDALRIACTTKKIPYSISLCHYHSFQFLDFATTVFFLVFNPIQIISSI